TSGRVTSSRPKASLSRSRRYAPVAADQYPVPLASDRSVNGAPVAPPNRQVSQSCGRQTVAVAAAWSGSCRASQRSLVMVNEATGTRPTASAHASAPPGSSLTRSAAAPADRVSFHSSAGRTTSPRSSRQTMPCCWPPTEIAATSSIPPASASADCSAAHHASGCTSVPSGWAARPERTSAPVSASRITTLQDWVDESTPATSVTPPPDQDEEPRRAPSRCSTASWLSRTYPYPFWAAASGSNSSNADRSASRS